MSTAAPEVTRTCVTHSGDGDGHARPVLVWGFDRPMRAVSSAVLGGGIRACEWVLNVEVSLAYDRAEPAAHMCEIALELGLAPVAGVAMLTAASVAEVTSASDHGACCDATVGLSFPTWAAAPEHADPPAARWRPGTINLVCALPVPLSDAALVNAVMTATEAKTQALAEAGVPGTGTASDAIVVCCPLAGPPEPYCGPRSLWGARLARAVHQAVAQGTQRYSERAASAASTPSRSASE